MEDLQSKVCRCWGKTDQNSKNVLNFHPALFHMIDVGHVAQILLSKQPSSRWSNVFSSIYGLDDLIIESIFPFILSLHDIGKISSSFQRQSDGQKTRLVNEGFVFGRSKDIPHSEVSAIFINYELRDFTNIFFPETLIMAICDMAAGHHGKFSAPGELSDIRKKLKFEEPAEWKDLRRSAFTILQKIFIKEPFPTIADPKNISAAIMQLTGFTILCDWIGSDQTFFVPSPDMSITDYISLSRKQAYKAVSEDGFLNTVMGKNTTQFKQLFPKVDVPRPLQNFINEIPNEFLSQPSLTVIEAPTGEGKTEAALALAHRIAQSMKTDEFFYALPTTATSNQMYLRVNRYLKENLFLDAPVKLVHGQAFLLQDQLSPRLLSNGEKDNSNSPILDWFNSKKRAILAPFGVGTIDQLELGALNVKYASLRLSGLAGKVVILDEVHAYDTYMTTIVIRLLEWLRELNTSVIILSATLPSNKRSQLIQAYFPESSEQLSNNSYPLVTIASEKKCLQNSPPAFQKSRKIKIEFIHFNDDDPSGKAQWLLNQVHDGGCICWIANTVNRAQEIYLELLKNAPTCIDKILFHARFPLDERQRLEEKVTDLFGPDKTHRPEKAIVIGTQVLEQSLDLDFDLMVSDLAPIDLLLQRAGRLHRHENTIRPFQLSVPTFFINTPFGSDNCLDVNTDSKVYSEFLLRTTYEKIKDLNLINLPDDYRILVEAIYCDEIVISSPIIKKSKDDLTRKEEFARQEALLRLLPPPDPDEPFTGPASFLTFTESETDASWVVAQTRLGEESINVIPLEDLGDFYSFPGCITPLHKSLPASREDELKMLRRQIRISHGDLGPFLKSQRYIKENIFTKSALLKDYIPIWMVEGESEVKTEKAIYCLKLDNKLGLVISKKGGK